MKPHQQAPEEPDWVDESFLRGMRFARNPELVLKDLLERVGPEALDAFRTGWAGAQKPGSARSSTDQKNDGCE